MRLLPLGDQAAIAYLDDETAALHFAAAVRGADFPWLVDVVQAYTSVAVFFDLTRIDYARAAGALRPLTNQAAGDYPVETRLHRIPCCYELGLDLGRVADHTNLPAEQIIRLHAESTYTVYAIGFCPGFPYLGYLPPELSGVPRLEAPRLRLERGSVGLTGRQTPLSQLAQRFRSGMNGGITFHECHVKSS